MGGGEVGVPQNIMRALCAVIWPDHFKIASYGPDLSLLHSTMALLDSTQLYHGSNWLYLTLLHSTTTILDST